MFTITYKDYYLQPQNMTQEEYLRYLIMKYRSLASLNKSWLYKKVKIILYNCPSNFHITLPNVKGKALNYNTNGTLTCQLKINI